MRIGLFGGTFDPIHWGHLRSAEEVSETFDLDRILFIPASIPPHKRGQTATPARDRLQMVRLAAAKNPRFRVSTVEISRIPSIRSAISPKEKAKTTRSFLSSVWMRFAKSALGRILPRFFPSAISS
jgi:nicotinate (nicotinamide) nucleotide adenylyltransferase